MNASRLRETVDLLLQREEQFHVQRGLDDLNNHISSLAGSPQDANHQTNFAQALEKLRSATAGLAASFQPAQVKLLSEIGADRFFSTDLATDIASWVQENPISPAVVQKNIARLLKERAAFIDDITQLRGRLSKLKIEAVALPQGDAELGILLPRGLFNNQLDQLIKELGVINHIIRTVSEVAAGSVQAIEVRQISTTDPQFFFGIDPRTIALFGAIVTWALSQWKRVEEIRKLRSETKKNNSFTEEEVKGFFDSKIERTIEQAIAKKTHELLASSKLSDGRTKGEMQTELTWVLRSILARIERGMTIEVRFVPPSETPTEDSKGAAAQSKSATFATLQQVASELVFPAPDSAPVLEIPPPEPQTERSK